MIIDYVDDTALRLGKPFAVICIVLGIITLLSGFVRYYYAENMLITGHYPMSSVSAFILVATTVVFIVLYLILCVKIIF